MIKKLTKHGNSLALVIDRPILDLLKIDPETPLDVSTDGKRLIVAPANPSTRAGSLTQLRSWPTSDMRRPFRSWPNKPPAQISWNRYSCVWTRCWRSTSNRSNDMASSGPRDSAALESAVATPQATFGGEFLHQSIPAMAAAYLFHICQNHAFLDGNKRTGANAAITFLLMNNWEPTFDEEELVDVVLSVASGSLNKQALIEIFESRCKMLEDT